jgi:GTPase SAR1 family protein
MYVVDVAYRDSDRLQELRETLYQHILSDPALEGIPLFVLANKQDRPDAMDTQEVIEIFELKSLKRPWHVVVRPSVVDARLTSWINNRERRR